MWPAPFRSLEEAGGSRRHLSGVWRLHVPCLHFSPLHFEALLYVTASSPRFGCHSCRIFRHDPGRERLGEPVALPCPHPRCAPRGPIAAQVMTDVRLWQKDKMIDIAARGRTFDVYGEGACLAPSKGSRGLGEGPERNDGAWPDRYPRMAQGCPPHGWARGSASGPVRAPASPGDAGRGGGVSGAGPAPRVPPLPRLHRPAAPSRSTIPLLPCAFRAANISINPLVLGNEGKVSPPVGCVVHPPGAVSAPGLFSVAPS